MSFWSWLSSLFGGHHTTPPAPPQQTPTHPIAFITIGAPGSQVVLDGHENNQAFTTNRDGYVLLNPARNLRESTLTVTADGFQPYAVHVSMDAMWDSHQFFVGDPGRPLNANESMFPGLVPIPPAVIPGILPRLRADGQHFVVEGGGPFTAIEASDFMLYQRHLNGENIHEVLIQRRDAGFNMLRIFGMVNGSLGHFIPGDYPNYFSELPVFYSTLANYGFYGEFVCFADTTQVMPDAGVQLNHWNQVVAALTPISNALLEAVNEADQAINKTESLASLPRPTTVFSSHGSNGSQVWPVQPYWDYATFHTNDASEWQRKVGHNAMEIWDGPTLSNENTRATDRFDNAQQAFDAAAGATLLCAGSCFHSIHGKSSELWDSEENAMATAWVNGARSVPLVCQLGPYKHRADLETPGVLRAYQRGDDPACVVLIHN
jgi:hypothetical protein